MTNDIASPRDGASQRSYDHGCGPTLPASEVGNRRSRETMAQ